MPRVILVLMYSRIFFVRVEANAKETEAFVFSLALTASKTICWTLNFVPKLTQTELDVAVVVEGLI
jgi:hypothetical protein